jgi:D-alanine-D-alanine ligase
MRDATEGPPEMSQPLSGCHVAVLMGRRSSELQVSLSSAAQCADALERVGAKVSRVEPQQDVAGVLGGQSLP